MNACAVILAACLPTLALGAGLEAQWSQAKSAMSEARASAEAAVKAQPPVAWDAFSESAECRIADEARPEKPLLSEAVALLKPCVAAVARRYGAVLSVNEGMLSTSANVRQPAIVFIVGSASVKSQAARNLRYSLLNRDQSLLGFPAVVVPEF
jgi:hypothetical protein